MNVQRQRNIGRAGLVLTAVDAGMTAAFGWLAASSIIMAGIYAAGLGALSFILAFLPAVAIACVRKGWMPVAILIMVIYAGSFFANFISNFGLTAGQLQSNIVAAQNKNTVADNAQATVNRLRSRDLELTTKIDFAPAYGGATWLAPTAYDSMIDGLKQRTERGRNIYQRSKQCTNTTVQSSQALCQAIRSAEATKANAIARLGLINERKQIRAELKAAETALNKTPKSVSPAAAQSEYLARLFTQSLKPDGDTVDWTLMGVSIAISFFISVFAHLCNAIVAMNLAGDSPEENVRPTRFIAPDEARTGPTEPIKLHSEPDPVASAQRLVDDAQAALPKTQQPNNTIIVANDDADLGAMLADLSKRLKSKAATNAA